MSIRLQNDVMLLEKRILALEAQLAEVTRALADLTAIVNRPLKKAS